MILNKSKRKRLKSNEIPSILDFPAAALSKRSLICSFRCGTKSSSSKPSPTLTSDPSFDSVSKLVSKVKYGFNALILKKRWEYLEHLYTVEYFSVYYTHQCSGTH